MLLIMIILCSAYCQKQKKSLIETIKKKKVVGQVLHDLIEKLVVEIKEHKTSFTDFKVLKKRDFNARTCSGLIIVKFKEYPFVVKLFMETPESFVQPFTKGWQPVCFFMMGGGVNRYLTGFTRFRNLEKIRDCILKDPEWAERIDTPRKWFWIPDTCRWFQMRSKNMGSYDQYRINLPCVYAIIADAVSVDKCFTLFNKNHRQTTMRLTQYLGNRIDPHIDNFMPEKDTNKIIIADTELFAVMVGLKKPLNFTNYKSWYLKLTLKSLQDMLFRSKRYWYNQQQCPQLPLFHEQLHEPESNCGVIKTLD